MQSENQTSMIRTPGGNRVRISFFGLRNAGKSTLVNEFCGQEVAIVSDVPGTTTDPVSKAMELLPLGPCTITDTAGLDDCGKLGEERVRRTLDVLAVTDIAVWVKSGGAEDARIRSLFDEECRRHKVVVLEHERGRPASDLKARISEVAVEKDPGLLDGLVERGDHVVLVCPIDESAPKGRLILPQVQVIRECLDRHATCAVCCPEELAGCVSRQMRDYPRPVLVVTDSQVFGDVRAALEPFRGKVRLTSFSILFARQKGDLKVFVDGMKAIASLKDGDTVLVSEGCTHHRQCNDIGTVKIPAALRALSGKNLDFVFSSGRSFLSGDGVPPALVVHCGGCMLTRREMLRRISLAREAGVAMVNYGLLLAMVNGLAPEEVMPDCSVCPAEA